MRIHTIPLAGTVSSHRMLHTDGNNIALSPQLGLVITKQGGGTGDSQPMSQPAFVIAGSVMLHPMVKPILFCAIYEVH